VKKHTKHLRRIAVSLGSASVLAMLCGAQEAATTQPTAAPVLERIVGPKLVTNIWVDTDLRQVIQDISSQTDTAIMCDQTVQGLVSMSVKNMPLQDCLERACAAGGYSFVKVKDYYVVGRAEPGNPMFLRVSEPVRVKLSNIVPDQVKSLLHPSLVPYVTMDKASGTVVVTAPEPMKQRILDALKLLDQPNAQVAIEAVVFELTEDGSKQLALDWQFKTPNISASSQGLSQTITYEAGSDIGTFVNMTLRAIIQEQRGQILANPRILVVNNTDAEIFVGQEEYFSLLSGQASNPYYTLESIKAGVTLKVSPYIGEDGQITLNLEPEVSDVVADNTGMTQGQPNAGPMPVVTRRHAKTVINIRDDQTVLIGGLLMEQNRSTVSKVPLLGDIPLIGAAFRSVQQSKHQQEVVILISAHVVDGKHQDIDPLTSRLEERYITPMDAIAVPLQGRPR
jgi:type II secretory pathway component GspD/PulD (secretin)